MNDEHILDLISKVKISSAKRTPVQRLELLKESNILDDDGNYCKEYFSNETIEHDLLKRKNNGR